MEVMLELLIKPRGSRLQTPVVLIVRRGNCMFRPPVWKRPARRQDARG